uniref:Secreted protein n=1 Tax=Mesocestoides corti TaxID=53468 RepID=A0A5K3FR26_MESCO
MNVYWPDMCADIPALAASCTPQGSGLTLPEVTLSPRRSGNGVVLVVAKLSHKTDAMMLTLVVDRHLTSPQHVVAFWYHANHSRMVDSQLDHFQNAIPYPSTTWSCSRAFK